MSDKEEHTHFCYDGDRGFETFRSEVQALKWANDFIDSCGYESDLEQLTCGEITHSISDDLNRLVKLKEGK